MIKTVAFVSDGLASIISRLSIHLDLSGLWNDFLGGILCR